MALKLDRKFIRSSFPILSVALMAISCWSQAVFGETRLRIGVAIPLSGSAGFLGVNTRAGIEFFFFEFPELKDQVELIYEDMTDQTINGINGVKKLLTVDQVDAMILEMSPVANAVGEQIDQARVPTIAIVGADSARSRSYMVKLWTPVANEASAVSTYLRERKFSRIAVITSEQDSMLARSIALRSQIPSNHLVLDAKVNGPDEMSTSAVRVKVLSPHVVVMNLLPGLYGGLARRLRELGYQGELIGTAILSEDNEVKLGRGALGGAHYPDVDIDLDFVRRFVIWHGSQPGLGVANGYDAMKMLLAAWADQKPTINREKLNQALRFKSFRGALGQYSFLEDGSNNFNLPARLRKVQQ